jgi:hypothetical protein
MAPVPPLATGRVPVTASVSAKSTPPKAKVLEPVQRKTWPITEDVTAVKAEVPLPLMMPVNVDAPVPPLGTVKSVVSVTAPVTVRVPPTLVFPENVPVVPDTPPENVPVVPATAVNVPAAGEVPPITALLIVPPVMAGVLIVGEDSVEVEMVTPAIVPPVTATAPAAWVDIVPRPVTWVLAIVIGSAPAEPWVEACVVGIATPWSESVNDQLSSSPIVS